MDGDAIDTEAIAAGLVDALDARACCEPVTDRAPGFDLAAAYRVAAAVRRLREGRGARVVGRKIGFTNRRIWPDYGVNAPIWGYMYDATVHDVAPEGADFAAASAVEPKIEPEIAFGLARAPAPGMDAAALMGCIGWVAHGVEMVQSIFPGWRFRAPDTVAGFGMHAAFLCGPRVAVTPDDRADWLARLADFRVTLIRDGAEADRGHAADVLGGPLVALGHLVALLAADPDNPPLAAGEIVTTGTVTRALDVAPGETWETRVEGVALPGLRLVFR